jgi:glycosyltransferase involved in cell wall biosynthesis
MKIGILGSRGIPNAYGGFEQFAQSFALYLVKKGHEVTVYNSSLHPNREPIWKGIKIARCYDPEDKIGTAGQFIYDLNCIMHSRKAGYDILLQLGYTSSAIWYWLMPKKTLIVTNMDGLEWVRSKYSRPVRKFLKYSEKLAANHSDYLVADSIGIQEHLKKNLEKESSFIAYGANLFNEPDENALSKYDVEKESYFLVIARMEPENNVEIILDGYVNSGSNAPILVIGNYEKSFGQYLKVKFNHPGVRFLGPVYNQDDLNNLRYYCSMYFHGHSVGGTNPSLLEAMASSAFVCAHDNIFNKSVLEENALYFRDSEDIAAIINSEQLNRILRIQNNREKIEKEYSEDYINGKYEALFSKILSEHSSRE